jgi:hypothetical protein
LTLLGAGQAFAQDTVSITKTANTGPSISGTEPATLAVTERNTVVSFLVSGRNLHGSRPLRLYVRLTGMPWQELYTRPRTGAGLQVEMVSVPFLTQPGRLELKAVLDGLDSNIYALRVVR